MKNAVSSKDIEPKCEYCERGRTSPSDGTVLCPLSGVMRPGSRCRRFKYSPLKRRPEAQRVKIDTDFSPEDFKL